MSKQTKRDHRKRQAKRAKMASKSRAISVSNDNGDLHEKIEAGYKQILEDMKQRTAPIMEDVKQRTAPILRDMKQRTAQIKAINAACDTSLLILLVLMAIAFLVSWLASG